ncbi:hypothetical protein [Streptomyces montanisoli]|uniref:Uncharacterized protein n=1 Tax=Streptomyces montanisoli TaxID=2798581 RepID=A0A940RTF7_9ACTN|nr:hypothetical protein [Streptomyces montanisoli]MBP0456040.1 hypothetical protein [Streptomyces montanisoli]
MPIAPTPQVRPVHQALHDIGAKCPPDAGSSSATSLTRDVDRILAFAHAYPHARFAVDDETGSTLSLLLVTRQAMRTCAPAEAGRVNQALPVAYREATAASP